MRWENAPSTSSNEVYHLWHNDKHILTLTLHPFANTVRIECAGEKRVFQIRREGFFRNKTILRNEYGIKIGELGSENESTFIDVNDERFYYHIHHKPQPEIVIFKESKDQPIVVCGLNGIRGETSVRLEKNRTPVSQSGLLMALCWYLFLPMTQQKVQELASLPL